MAWEFYDSSGNIKTTAAGNTVAVLDDILDVDVTGVVDGSLLRYEATGAVWNDTTSGTLLLTDAGQLQIPTTGSGAGILLGGDVQLYRSAANQLTIPDTTIISVAGGGKNELQITSTTANTGITIGGDTNLYRTAANILKTDDKIQQPTVPTEADDLTNQVYVDRMDMFFS